MGSRWLCGGGRLAAGLLCAAIVGGIVGCASSGSSPARGAGVSATNRPASPAERAEQAMRRSDFAAAQQQFETALASGPRTAPLLARYGDCLHALAPQDPERLANKDLEAWEQALTLDPRYLPALQRLLDGRARRAMFFPSLESCDDLRAAAERVLAVVPADPHARAWRHLAPIIRWLQADTGGIEVVEADVDELLALRQKDPTNANIPYYLSLAGFQQAKEVRSRGEHAEAEQFVRDAVESMDVAAAGQPANALMQLRYVQVLARAKQWERDRQRDAGKPAQQAGAATPASLHDEQIEQALARARAAVRPQDAEYVDAYIQSADHLLRTGKPESTAAAERLMRESCAQRPNDQRARLALVSVILAEPRRRGEAIELLRKPITDPVAECALAWVDRPVLEFETWMGLAGALLDAGLETNDAAERSRLRDEVLGLHAKLEGRLPGTVAGLKIKAKLALIDGRPDSAARAIPLLEEARRLWQAKQQAGAMDPSAPARDWDLEYLLARCYFDRHQTGEARDRLFDLVDRFPTFALPRMLLAEVLLTERELDLAAEQVAELRRLAPTDPNVARLQVALDQARAGEPAMPTTAPATASVTTAPAGRADPARADLVKNLPETDFKSKLEKARICVAAKLGDEAVRLLEDLRAEAPSDADVIGTLVLVYGEQGTKDKAVEVAKAALAQAPDDPRLQWVLAGAEGRSSRELRELERKVILTIADDYERNVKLYALCRREGQSSEAVKYLALAERARPDDPRLAEERFRLALQAQAWEEAERRAERLAALDADQAGGRVYRFELAMARGDATGAETIAKELVKDVPHFASSWLSLADAQRALGRAAEAKPNYGQALQKQSDNLDAIRGMIACCDLLGQPEEIRRYLDLGLRLAPRDPQFREQRVRYDLLYGDPTRGIAARQAESDAHNDELPPQVALYDAEYQVARRLIGQGKAAEAQPHLARAAAGFEWVLGRWPNNPEALAHQAEVAELDNRPADAERALRALIALPSQKEKHAANLLLAEHFARRSLWDAAEEQYRAALTKSHNAPDVRRAIVRFFIVAGRQHKILDVLDRRPTDPDERLQVVGALNSLHRWDEAEWLLTDHLLRHPNDVRFLNELALVQLSTRRHAAALETLGRALEADSRNAWALYYRAMTLLDEFPPDVDAALRDLRAARDAAPQATHIRSALADAHLYRGETATALRELELAVELAPTNAAMRLRLIELYEEQTPPRFQDAERLLAAARQVPGGGTDPTWPRAEAFMWLRRNQPDKAGQAARIAMKLGHDPQQFATRVRVYLDCLRLARRWPALRNECDTALGFKGWANDAWWVYALRGTAFAGMDRPRDASRDFDQAERIARRQGSVEAMEAVAAALAAAMGPDEAERRLDAGVAQSVPLWNVCLARGLLRRGYVPRAVALIERTMRSPEWFPPEARQAGRAAAAEIYTEAGQQYRDRAAAAYEALLAADPEDVAAMLGLACLCVDAKPPDLSCAAGLVNRAMKLVLGRGRPDARTLEISGWVLLHEGKLDEAERDLRLSLCFGPTASAYYHVAVLRLRQRRPVDAEHELAAARQQIEGMAALGLQAPTSLVANIERAAAEARAMRDRQTAPAPTP